ncbi:MAG TPA: GTP-binding protein, partial [Dehalococcoidia bacterium]
MKEYPADSIRNVALVGHSGTGKTTLAESMLFAAGAVTRLGTIEDHTTTSDWDPDEHKRGFSLSLSIVPLEWNDRKINVIDTPGYMDFMGEVKCGLRAVETALITIDAVSSLEVGTEFAWRFADELELPRAVFINRMDRDNADFDRCVSDIQATWGNKCLPVTLPIGSQSSFQGVVDLLTMKAYSGDKGVEGPIPDEMQGAADQAREKLIEAAAETDDSLINKYLEGEELSAEELSAGIRDGIAARSLIPILAGAGTKVMGVRRLLNAITDYFPSPTDRPARAGDKELKADPAGTLTALVFKTSADPYVGRLTYFRVLSGTLASDSHAWNATKDVDERIGTVYHITGKNQDQVPQIIAGDIGAVAKLADTHTGDTLCAKGSDVKLDPISFPNPSA